MDVSMLEDILMEIQNGNELARETIIKHYKPYIQNVASRICRRYITWKDEEASIALIAFNRAIDTFDKKGGRSFQAYGYLLMHRDLIDYFRKENKNNFVSLNEDDSEMLEYDTSLQMYEQSIKTSELVDEILELDTVLSQFNISFEELEQFSPKHEDTRKMVFQLVEDFISDEECVSKLLEKKVLPLSLFSKKVDCKKKTLERHRKYLITLILLKLHPEWVHLNEYMRKSPRKEGKR